MVKIDSVRAKALVLDVPVPSTDGVARRSVVVTRVRLESGETGYGVASGPVQHFAIEALVNDEIGPLFAGKEIVGPEHVQIELMKGFNRRMQTGVWSMAASAIDIAAWDCYGQMTGQPVFRMLGGSRSEVPYYVTFGVAEYDLGTLKTEASRQVSEGHPGVKMVVGGHRLPDASGQLPGAHGPLKRPISEEIERVIAVRETIGADCQLMIDANLLMTLKEAWRLADGLRGASVTYFEEPVSGNDPQLLAHLRRAVSTPIAAGGSIGNIQQFASLMASESLDIPQPNVVNVGGYTAARKVAALAEARSLSIGNGQHWPHFNAHLHAAVPNGGAVEFHWFGWTAIEMLFDHDHRLVPDVGQFELSESAGTGLKLKDESIFSN